MSELTELLEAVNRGEAKAADDLFTFVYSDLKRIAGQFISNENAGHTLQPTALVHEAYLRLLGGRDADSPPLNWQRRGHFFAAAAQAMRRILVESARRKKSEKRGGGLAREPFDLERVAEPQLADDLLALHDALDSLATIEPDIATLVNLRYFGGLTIREAAEVLCIAPRTADSHWAYARAWLLAEMNAERS